MILPLRRYSPVSGETDNAVAVKPGNGVRKTFTALGKVQRRYVDPANQSAGYFGTIGPKTTWRRAEYFWTGSDPAPDHPVAKEARSSRGAMIAAANSYATSMGCKHTTALSSSPTRDAPALKMARP
jgi:hypothetical protein